MMGISLTYLSSLLIDRDRTTAVRSSLTGKDVCSSCNASPVVDIGSNGNMLATLSKMLGEKSTTGSLCAEMGTIVGIFSCKESSLDLEEAECFRFRKLAFADLFPFDVLGRNDSLSSTEGEFTSVLCTVGSSGSTTI